MKMSPIPGFPTYFATSSGSVYRITNGTKKKLKPNITKEGYSKYDLYKTVNGKLIRKTIKTQGIMKLAFNLKGQVIDHKNGNRTSNSLSNLRGVSFSTNNSNRHGHKYPHARTIYGKK